MRSSPSRRGLPRCHDLQRAGASVPVRRGAIARVYGRGRARSDAVGPGSRSTGRPARCQRLHQAAGPHDLDALDAVRVPTPARWPARTRAGPPRPAAAGVWATWRSSPPRPTSPQATRSAGTGLPGRATRPAPGTRRGRCPARRAAPRRWPTRRRPRLRSARPARCSSTAVSSASRPWSSPWAERRGQRERRRRPPGPGPRRAAAAGPRRSGTTTEPGTPVRRSARNRPLGSGTPTRPASVISNRPSSLGGAEAVLDRPQQPQGVVTLALEREHGVDDVLEHPRARPARPPW